MRRSIATLTMVLVLLTGQASAGTAWVLWEKAVAHNVGGWDVHSAYPDYEMCVKKRDAKLAHMLDLWKASNPGYFAYGFIVMGGKSPNDGSPEQYFWYEVKCLPDTIDLRK